MTVARLRVEAAGPLTSLQDAGRPGWQRFGVPPSGPVDRRAFAAARAALGTSAGVTAIEVSHGGATLLAEEGAIAFALTGAIAAEIDGRRLGTWTTGVLAAGQRLRLRSADGNWGYLAVAGTIAASPWLGSTATHLIAGLGGGQLVAGATLTIERARFDLVTGPIPRPSEQPLAVARIVIGPQERFFTRETLALLTAAPFAATAQFDRMGMVLAGRPLLPTRIDMPSEPATRGALQVAGDGRVSLLTADYQATGGYPRIATVIGADIDRLAQLPAGAPIRFVAVTPEQAIVTRRASHAKKAEWLAQIAEAARPLPSLLETNLIGGVVDALADRANSA